MASPYSALLPLSGPSHHDPQSALGTSAVKVAALVDADAGPRVRRVRIANLSSSNRIAYKLVPAGAPAPTITTTGDANTGIVIFPEAVEFLVIGHDVDLYLAASGASTPVDVSWIEQA